MDIYNKTEKQKERIDFKKGNISFYPASGQWFVSGIVFSLYKVVRAGVPRFRVLRLEYTVMCEND